MTNCDKMLYKKPKSAVYYTLFILTYAFCTVVHLCMAFPHPLVLCNWIYGNKVDDIVNVRIGVSLIASAY
jgi:hypothetical protein